MGSSAQLMTFAGAAVGSLVGVYYKEAHIARQSWINYFIS